MPYVFNPFTGRLDWTAPPAAETDPVFNAWLLATPPLYGATSITGTFGEAWTYTTTPLLIYCDTENARGGGAGRWYLVDANDTAPVEISKYLGFVKETSTGAADTGTVYVGGTIDGFTGLTPGAVQWASDTAGAISETEPSTPADGAQTVYAQVGVAISATEVILFPDRKLSFAARETVLLGTVGTMAVEHVADAGTRKRTVRAYAIHPAVVDANLKAWYKLDENAGVAPQDSSGNANHASLVGGVSWEAADKPGLMVVNVSSIHLNGSTGYVLGVDMLDLNTAGDKISAAVWAKRHSTGTIDTLVAKYEYNGAINQGWYLRYNAADKLEFVVNAPAGTNNTWTSTNVIANSTDWRHLAFTYTSGTGASLVVYVDGSPIAGSWTAGDGNTSPSNTAGPITLGCIKYTGGGGGTADFFDGLIDEVRLYDRTLSATEFQNLADGYNEDGSTTYNPFDAPLQVGDWVADTSGLVVKYGDVYGADSDTFTTLKNKYAGNYDVVALVEI